MFGTAPFRAVKHVHNKTAKIELALQRHRLVLCSGVWSERRKLRLAETRVRRSDETPLQGRTKCRRSCELNDRADSRRLNYVTIYALTAQSFPGDAQRAGPVARLSVATAPRAPVTALCHTAQRNGFSRWRWLKRRFRRPIFSTCRSSSLAASVSSPCLRHSPSPHLR